MRAIDLFSILVIWQKHTTCLSTDKRVLDKMTELANAGVRCVPEMQRRIKHYVEQVLFAGSTVPPPEDSRFWPSGKAVMNCIYRAVRRARFVISFLSITFIFTMRQHVIQCMILPHEFRPSICLWNACIVTNERFFYFFVYTKWLPCIVTFRMKHWLKLIHPWQICRAVIQISTTS